MFDSGDSDAWRETVGDLDVVRQTSKSGGSTLSRLRLTNEGHETVATRIVEQLPVAADSTMLLTTTSDVSDAWRHVGGRVVNEFVVPPGHKRTAAFLIRADVDPPLSLDPPEIRAVETATGGADLEELFGPVDGSSDGGDDPSPAAGGVSNGPHSQPKTTDGGAPGSPSPTRSAATEDGPPDASGSDERNSDGSPVAESVDEPRDGDAESGRDGSSGTSHDRSPGGTNASSVGASSMQQPDGVIAEQPADEHEEGSDGGPESGDADRPSTDGAPETASSSAESDVVDQLLTALREQATQEQRRALRSELGASESERLRLVHLESRLEEFAAYVDALETILDAHGADVVDEMHESIEENTTRTEALREELAALDGRLESYHSDADDSLAELERDLASVRADHDERVSAIESTLEEMRSELSSLQSQVDDDRQVQARALRRIDESVSRVREQVEELEADVQQGRAFRERFTDAIAPGQDDTDGEPQGADAGDD